MTARLVALAFDALDPRRLASFWAEALGWDVDAGSDDDASADAVRLVPTDGNEFPLLFVRTAAAKTGQNRVHLDLTTTSLDDQRDTVARLVALGGRHVDLGQRPEEGHVVLADPEDNELCILAPGNAFLAGCGRLGAINADGTRRVGLFWRDVLGWPLVWDQDEETAIRSPDRTGPLVTWSGPPLIPKHGPNRLRLVVAPADADATAQLARLGALGATRRAAANDDPRRTLLADPDDNEFEVVRPT